MLLAARRGVVVVRARGGDELHAQAPAVDVHLVVLLDASLGFFLRFKLHLPGVVVSEKSSFGFRVDVLAHGCEIVLVELLGEVRDAYGVR